MDKHLRCKWAQIYATSTPFLKNILQGVSANNREVLCVMHIIHMAYTALCQPCTDVRFYDL